jgi:hypothetical protein
MVSEQDVRTRLVDDVSIHYEKTVPAIVVLRSRRGQLVHLSRIESIKKRAFGGTNNIQCIRVVLCDAEYHELPVECMSVVWKGRGLPYVPWSVVVSGIARFTFGIFLG